MQLKEPGGLCFTDAGTLLVTDSIYRVQHLTLDGTRLAVYKVRYPKCIASRSDIIVVGTLHGVRVFSLANRHFSSDWPDDWLNECFVDKCFVTAVTFVDDSTLAVAVYRAKMIGLYALNGTLKRKFGIDTISNEIHVNGIAVCADGCLLVSNYFDRQQRARVFSIDDSSKADTLPFLRKRKRALLTGGINEIFTSSFATRSFAELRGIAVNASHAYVLEDIFDETPDGISRIHVFM